MSEKKRVRVVAARVPIRDGFTQDATYRDGQNVMYAGTQITYRPALPEAVADFLDDPRKYIVKGRQLVLKYVTGWNVADDTGENVAEINEQTVKELAYPVLDFAVNCITGYAPTKAGEEEKN
jgi:hypothetical protein